MLNTTLQSFTTQDRFVLLFVHVTKEKIRQKVLYFIYYSVNSRHIFHTAKNLHGWTYVESMKIRPTL